MTKPTKNMMELATQVCAAANLPVPSIQIGCAGRGADGVYICKTSEIILDKRNPNVLLHELAHYIAHVNHGETDHGLTWRAIYANILVYHGSHTRSQAENRVFSEIH